MCQPRDICAYVHTECHSTRNAFHWKSGQYANKWSSQRCELWYDRCYVHKVCVAATITINLAEPLHFSAGVCVLNWFCIAWNICKALLNGLLNFQSYYKFPYLILCLFVKLLDTAVFSKSWCMYLSFFKWLNIFFKEITNFHISPYDFLCNYQPLK